MSNYKLLLVIKKNGRIKKVTHYCATERQADETQLSELSKAEAQGAELVDAFLFRQRAITRALELT